MIKYTTIDNSIFEDSIVIADSTVARLYGICARHMLTIDGGEEAKCWDKLIDICQWLLDIGATKNNTVYAVGGGTIGDIVGLACSLYKRGVSVVHIPTTLLAMIDSSIGGKTALNMGGVKNAIGSIYRGDTYIDTNYLSTLSPSELDNGMGEVYKYMLLDSSIAKLLGNTDKLIESCVIVKQSIVERDPYDSGVRQCLNMGHTIAHAIELRHNMSHGQAVACGCHYALTISLALGLVSQSYFDKWHAVAKYTDIQLEYSDILAMTTDKKNTNDNITLVLPTNNYSYTVRQFSHIELADILGVACSQ